MVVFPAIGLALWRAYFVQTYRAAPESMQPALEPGERFVVLKLDRQPDIGEIVVFSAPRGMQSAPGRACGAPDVPAGAMCPWSTAERTGTAMVMRVVGLGGDRLRMRGGRVLRNGAPERGYSVRACTGEACSFEGEITVPDGRVFLLGDNRGSSFDSRFWGAVPKDWIRGRHWFSYAGD